MLSRRSVLGILAFLALSVQVTFGQAPRLEKRFSETPLRSPLQAERLPTYRLVIGGLTGGLVGFFAGGFAGAVINETEDDIDGFDALAGFAVGAAIGESIMLPLGVHLANKRQGDYGAALGASVLIGAAFIGIVTAADDAAIILVGAPVAQLLSSIMIERSTAN